MLSVLVNYPPEFPSGPPAPEHSPTPPPPGQSRQPIVGDGPPEPYSAWKKLLAPLAAAAVLVAKFFAQLKFLIVPALKFFPVILKSGGSMLLMIWTYALMWGWKWAVGFVLLLLLHECGHLVAARLFGLKVSAPVFIPFMGAFIALKEAPRDAWMEACVGIGGPILGSLAALGCQLLGMTLDSPLLISLAFTAYFLNLFNLVPLGQLDGGRVAVALSPWLWLPGLAIMGWLAWQRTNVLIILILVLSVPQVIALFRKRTAEMERYLEVTPLRRVTMATMYFGLIGLLFLAMHITHDDLLRRQQHSGGRVPVVAMWK
jgi:Zn-dependent protease